MGECIGWLDAVPSNSPVSPLITSEEGKTVTITPDEIRTDVETLTVEGKRWKEPWASLAEKLAKASWGQRKRLGSGIGEPSE